MICVSRLAHGVVKSVLKAIYENLQVYSSQLISSRSVVGFAVVCSVQWA